MTDEITSRAVPPPDRTDRSLTPSDRYRDAIAAGRLTADPGQAEAVSALDRCYAALCQAPPAPVAARASAGLLARWTPWARAGRRAGGAAGDPKDPVSRPAGLYLFGPVGRGKSMVMDLFVQSLPEGWGRRMHFHAFMRDAHAQLHRWRSDAAAAEAGRPRPGHRPGPGRGGRRDPGGDPIPRLARALVAGHRVLCLDELDIQDIGDAMIVARLFQALLDLGIVFVTTSNRPPEDLYKDGLQRDKVLPFIALLQERLEIVPVLGARDHRRDRLRGRAVYLCPHGPEATVALDRWMADLAGDQAPQPDSLTVHGRSIPVRAAVRGAGRFSFNDLCARPLGSHDYLAIADRFAVVVMDDLPALGPANADAARRFVVLVDALYDRGALLVCSAAAPPDALYTRGQGAFEFARTASRLLEMQSQAYITQALDRVPVGGS